MKRSYFDCPVTELARHSDNEILGSLAASHAHALELLQRDAWIGQLRSLREALSELSRGHLFLEFSIPRMGKRVDAVVLLGESVLVLEYKVGAKRYEADALRQVMDYALDLKNFHEGSHKRRVVPILVATDAPLTVSEAPAWYGDHIARPLTANDQSLGPVLSSLDSTGEVQVDAREWAASRYKPTPTIVEAARALYRGHSVAEISRSDAGAINLSRTADSIGSTIEWAKRGGRKVVCFVTGVPGSGKTLAGLNLATERMRTDEEEHAVFLSGNGPLVAVLREALARDDVEKAKAEDQTLTKTEAKQKASAFIQNIHHFRDEALQGDAPPVERVVVFDEAQRAWDEEQTSKFMRAKRQIPGFHMSEPEFLLSVMDRHSDWCVVVCLVGNGQEIHTGEAGIREWFEALGRRFAGWHVRYSPRFAVTPSDAKALEELPRESAEDSTLHLGVSVRSFRAERLSDFVASVLVGDSSRAREIQESLTEYPLVITRELASARDWLRSQARGGERFGLVASSNALRLKPEGIHVKAPISVAHWFLDGPDDIRSSYALEDAASEFEVQGLELDWVGVCWDANLRYEDGWKPLRFSGSRWLPLRDSRASYLINAYRVLLTRARQGLVVFVPNGDSSDATRAPEFYDGVYSFLVECGFTPLA